MTYRGSRTYRRRDQKELFSEEQLRLKRQGFRAPEVAYRPHATMSELSQAVEEGYDRLSPEMKNEYGPSALLDHIAGRLPSELRSDIAHANRLKRSSLEAIIERRQAERHDWVRGGRRRRR